jgi:hypothetical protein
MPGIRLVDVRAALAALGLAALAALAVVVVAHLPVPAVSGPATHASSTGLSRLQSLPLQAQSVISSTVAADSRAFAARRTASGWDLSGGGVRADFRAGAPVMRTAGGTLSLSLAGVTAPSSVTARGNRVTLTRPGLREWYAAGPLGIEQGFTLAHRPAAAAGHLLTLSLAVGGELRARASGADIAFVSPRGANVLRYGGLTAVDAARHRLPGTLRVQNGHVLITIDARGARYPITIDPLVQQSGKLVPNDLHSGGGNGFGNSTALSADGNMALIGASGDNSGAGGVWVFTRSGGVWSQQGSKIRPQDASATAKFGTSVALSTDGTTALIGGEGDGGTGAAWAFTRAGSGWTEQTKLSGSGSANAQFGHSVALSTDGNTALVGEPGAGVGAGQWWAFIRLGSMWMSQGGGMTAGNGAAGSSVALSSDGNTALIGSPTVSNGGSASVFTRSNGTWNLQTTTPLTGALQSASAMFGAAVALSSDGNTALVGGPADANAVGGAAWVFTRANGAWSAQGGKLVPTNASGSGTQFGSSVALSAGGNTALIGASAEAGTVGAAYLYARSGGVWAVQQRLTGAGETGAGAFGSAVALASDGQTGLIGAPQDPSNVASNVGAVFIFAPPNPVCNSVSGTGPQGGGSIAVALSCTLPSGAHPAFSVLGGPSNGTLSNFNATTGHLTYTSAAFFSGQDSFTYRVSDQWGISNIATATLNIPFLPVPTCSNVTAKGKKGGTKVTVTLKCTGPAGYPFTYGIVSQPSSGKLGKVNESNGKLTYTTHVGFGGKDRFVYNATNSGGSSKAATATIVLPKLGRITATMGWDAFGGGATSTVLPDMVVKNLPGGAKVKLSCSKGCPVKARTLALAKHRVCIGKGKKRKCKLVTPKSGNLDLKRYVIHRRVKVGSQLTVAMIQPGSIGKQYVFRMVKNNQPSVKIQTLAPGSTRLCPSC